MAVTADSIQTSLIFAGSSLPTESSGSISISICKLLFFNNIPLGLSGSPMKPTNFSLSAKLTVD